MPIGAAEPAALEAALAVVAEPEDHAAERLRAGIEQRAAGVVLEAGDRPPLARLELGVEQHVSDHPPVARHGLERQHAGARHLVALMAAIAAPEQLVAAAHGEQRRAAGDDRLAQRLRLRREIRRDEQLLAVLAAADVIEVVRARHDRVVEPELRHVELVSAPRRAPREHRDVAAVGVDVEVLGIEMPDADRRHAARSQYGRARPRSATIRWSSSIAVYVGSTTSSPPSGVSVRPRSSARARSGSTSIASSAAPRT